VPIWKAAARIVFPGIFNYEGSVVGMRGDRGGRRGGGSGL
jgi:hypothetical protein